MSFLSGVPLDTKVGGPRISTASGGSRPPLPSVHNSNVAPSGSTVIPPLFAQKQRQHQARTNTAPQGATRPQPPTRPQSNGSAIPAVRRNSGSAARPPSSGSLGGSGSASFPSDSRTAKQELHKGLVSALHEVLRKQRHGVFPQPVTTNDVEAMRQFHRPSTAESDANGVGAYGSQQPQQFSSRPQSRDESSIDALIRQRKMQWAQNRWKNIREQERKELERQQQTRYRVDTPTQQIYEEAEEFLDEETIAQLHNLERMERQGRQSILNIEQKRFRELTTKLQQLEDTIEYGPNDDLVASVSGGDPEALKTEGNKHYEAGNYLAAHRHYSMAIEVDPTNPLLLTNRAAANMAMQNYDAVVKDCLKAVTLDPHLVKGYARMAHGYLLLGQGRQANRQYQQALEYATLQGLPTVDRLRKEMSAVAVIEKARQLHEADNHEQVVNLVDENCPFAGDPPIALLRLKSLSHVDPSKARTELTKLLSSLEHPAVGGAETILLGNATTFYCDVLVNTAKASFYCGQHYMNIAKNHLAQCLAIRRDHKAATALERSINQFDQRFQQANQLFQQSKYAEAHASYTLALAVDPSNRKLQSLVFFNRAETSIKMGNIPAVISDCTSALECDGNNLKALTRRAKCFGDIGDFRRAVRDLERAVALNPSLADELQEMQKRQQTDEGHSDFFNSRPRSSSQYHGAHSHHHGSGDAPRRPQTSSEAHRCHYSVLGLPRFADLTSIRQQYRKLTLRYHPDKCVNETTEQRKHSELRFKEISHSYSALNDEQQKQLYDMNLRQAQAMY